MNRVVCDTNVVISGLLWSGSPRLVLKAIETGRVTAFISEVMLDELKDVMSRPKFAQRLSLIGQTAPDLVSRYLRYATVIEAAPIVAVVSADPDDDHVIACAVAARAAFVVTGDPHLLDIGRIESIEIVDPASFLQRLPPEE